MFNKIPVLKVFIGVALLSFLVLNAHADSNKNRLEILISDFGINQWRGKLETGKDFKDANNQFYANGDVPRDNQILVVMPRFYKWFFWGEKRKQKWAEDTAESINSRIEKSIENDHVNRFEIQLIQDIADLGYFQEWRQRLVADFGKQAYSAIGNVVARNGPNYDVRTQAVVGSNGTSVLLKNYESWRNYLGGTTLVDGRAKRKEVIKAFDEARKVNPEFKCKLINTKGDLPAVKGDTIADPRNAAQIINARPDIEAHWFVPKNKDAHTSFMRPKDRANGTVSKLPDWVAVKAGGWEGALERESVESVLPKFTKSKLPIPLSPPKTSVSKEDSRVKQYEKFMKEKREEDVAEQYANSMREKREEEVANLYKKAMEEAEEKERARKEEQKRQDECYAKINVANSIANEMNQAGNNATNSARNGFPQACREYRQLYMMKQRQLADALKDTFNWCNSSAYPSHLNNLINQQPPYCPEKVRVQRNPCAGCSPCMPGGPTDPRCPDIPGIQVRSDARGNCCCCQGR